MTRSKITSGDGKPKKRHKPSGSAEFAKKWLEWSEESLQRDLCVALATDLSNVPSKNESTLFPSASASKVEWKLGEDATGAPRWYVEESKLVHSPSHYTGGNIECIDAIESALTPEQFIGFCRGNAMKYLWRSGRKENTVQDLQKAQWYTDREIVARGKEAVAEVRKKKIEVQPVD